MKNNFDSLYEENIKEIFGADYEYFKNRIETTMDTTLIANPTQEDLFLECQSNLAANATMIQMILNRLDQDFDLNMIMDLEDVIVQRKIILNGKLDLFIFNEIQKNSNKKKIINKIKRLL